MAHDWEDPERGWQAEGVRHMHDDETPKRRGRWPGIILALLLLGFVAAVAAAWYFVDRQGMPADGPPPLIKSDSRPVKKQPEDPGGMEIDHQDKSIYDIGESGGSPEVEQLLPRAEEPISLPPASSGQGNDAPPMRETAEPSRPLRIEPVPPAQESGPGVPQVIEAAPTTVTPRPRPSFAEAAPSGEVNEPAALAPSVTPAPAAEPTAPVASGGFAMQLAAMSSRDSALQEFSMLRGKYPDVLNMLQPDIEEVAIPGKGPLFRLYAGPLTEAAAETACGKLKARGQACLVRQR